MGRIRRQGKLRDKDELDQTEGVPRSDGLVSRHGRLQRTLWREEPAPDDLGQTHEVLYGPSTPS